MRDWGTNADEYKALDKQGKDWRLMLLVACSVQKGTGGPRTGPIGPVSKVSTRVFGERAGSGHARIARHLDAYDALAEQGLVPPSSTLSPDDVDGFVISDEARTAFEQMNITPIRRGTAPVRKQSTRRSRTGQENEAEVGRFAELRDQVRGRGVEWGREDYAKRLGVSHQEARRLELYADAPPPIQQALFSGEITAAVAETVLDSVPGKALSVSDQVLVVQKILDGLIENTGAPQLRDTLATVARAPDSILLQWRTEEMSQEELIAAVQEHEDRLTDFRADAKAQQRAANQRSAEIKAAVNTGYDRYRRLRGWLRTTRAELDAIIEEFREFAEIEPDDNITGEVRSMSNELWVLADEIEEKKGKTEVVIDESRGLSDPNIIDL